MATTNKSSKAKTKIQPAKARKASAAAVKKPITKTTSPARSVKKSVSTKIVKEVPIKKASVSPRATGTGFGLRQLSLVSAVVSLGLAVAAGLLMNNRAYELTAGLLTKNELASQTTTVFTPAIHSMYDLQLRYAVVAIMALSALMPLFYLVRRKGGSDAVINTRMHFWRWLEIGVISGLMVEVVALLSGIQDILTLKVLGGTIVVSSLLRWVAEKQQNELSGSRRATSTLSIVNCLLPGLLIGGYAIATYLYGMVRTPWYVYALYATLVAGFVACVTNLYYSVKRLQASPVTQRNYSLISLATRIAFAVILIIGLRKINA